MTSVSRPRLAFFAVAILFVELTLASHARAQQGTAPTPPPAAGDPHAPHGHQKPAGDPVPVDPAAQPGRQDHEQHVPGRTRPETTALPAFIPPVTDDDRRAAFPDVEGHTVHDRAVRYFVLLDQLEWQAADDRSGLNLDTKGWIGRDRDRLWFRAEGDGEDGRVGEAGAHLLYGRQVWRWWDVVAGIRQDFQPGAAQTWAAIGVQGLAPYWFEVEATAYAGASGRTHARLEVDYELLFTNRLVLQPLFELDVYGRSDPERGIGAGLSTTEAGFRLRYELRRELAPYIGVTWNRKYGKTADFAADAGQSTTSLKLLAGFRLWF
jgi:copper resistance protein B